MKKLWKIIQADTELRETLGRELDILPVTAQILINRGLVEVDKAFSFLSPELSELLDPFLMKDMEKAVQRIALAITGKEKIAVYGDYDVDGTSASTLLYLFFKEIGVDVEVYIPERMKEGYGVNKAAIDSLAEKGTKVIITVDTGISNAEEVRHASKIGVDFIITDHHECPEKLPPAHAIVNPMRPDCDYPFKGLAGVGVAFKFITALRAHLRDNG
ncbi:MAG: DHH family phosphoesterase, partial [Deltaproteobacteria bacterium]|nr:DHH family phosphoesterase [Deltaproteobacteria bacterium]